MSEVLRLRDGVEWRRVEGDVLALDNESSTFYTANRTGAVVWAALIEGATRDELVQRIVAAFDVDEDVARRDLDGFLRALSDKGLLAPTDR